jgi:Alpha 1,4-glycosyltransferase conserved region
LFLSHHSSPEGKVDLSGLAEIHSLWIGERLSWIELVSLRSWLEHGHQVTLWCYDPIEGVPNGICTADAGTILPKTSIIRHRQTRSVALFSNRFRYHLLRRTAATWLDSDMVLLRPLNDTSPYLFGWEMATRIGTAVLRLPQESAVLHDLRKLTDARVPVPPWWPLKGRLKQHIKGLIGRHRRAEYMDWGTFGPKALTYFLSRRDLAGRALPVEAFYPINWKDASLFFAMPDAVSSRLTPNTIGVHLWSTSIVTGVDGQKTWGTRLPPANSWLGAMCKRYGIGLENSPLGY